MNRSLLVLLSTVALSTAAHASSTFSTSCTPVADTNSSVTAFSLFFTQGSGTGRFNCSDASLGAVDLLGVSISIFTDYTAGNGSNTDSLDNSAGFTFSNSDTTWAAAHPGAFTSTMSLSTAPGVTVFTIGNLSSSANTFTNTTSGGLAGTSFIAPTTEDQSGSLVGIFAINVQAFIDAGGFTGGASDAHVDVTYTYDAVTTPEPASLLFVGAGLLAAGLAGRKLRRK